MSWLDRLRHCFSPISISAFSATTRPDISRVWTLKIRPVNEFYEVQNFWSIYIYWALKNPVAHFLSITHLSFISDKLPLNP